jgi:multidrug efflux system outer membrane protein
MLLAACTSAPGPQDSKIETPGAWNGLSGTDPRDAPLATSDTAKIEQRWWQSFGDPALDRLVDGALAGNKTLRIAEARVEEARAGRQAAVANLMPDISAVGSASRGNQGYATLNQPVGIGELDLQASWEIDLFGKNQARAAAADAILQSADAHRQAVMVSLLAEIARNYFELRNDEAQIAITGKNLATEQRTLELIRAQQAGALSSDLDVARAAAQVATTSAQLPALRAAREVTLNRLNVLIGAAPGTSDAWLAPGAPLQPLAPTILVAAPARVLANRPDIRSAERALAASAASSDAAAREIYPTISLTSLFGVQQSSLFGATPWGVGAGLVQPLLDFGRIRADIDAADARQTQAFLGYQETVLEALEDMEDALSLYLNETGRQRDLQLAAGRNRQAVDLATQQYTAGYSGLLDLLVAQRDELDAESSLAASDTRLRETLVRIYAAAGGGWDL